MELNDHNCSQGRISNRKNILVSDTHVCQDLREANSLVHLGNQKMVIVTGAMEREWG